MDTLNSPCLILAFTFSSRAGTRISNYFTFVLHSFYMLSLSSSVSSCLCYTCFGLQVFLKVVLHLYLLSFRLRRHCKVSSLRPGDMFLSVFSLQTAGLWGGDGAIEKAGVFAAIWHMPTKGLSQIIGRPRHGSSDTVDINIQSV